MFDFVLTGGKSGCMMKMREGFRCEAAGFPRRAFKKRYGLFGFRAAHLYFQEETA